jgi:hypothetical protein
LALEACFVKLGLGFIKDAIQKVGPAGLPQDSGSFGLGVQPCVLKPVPDPVLIETGKISN